MAIRLPQYYVCSRLWFKFSIFLGGYVFLCTFAKIQINNYLGTCKMHRYTIKNKSETKWKINETL
jgi:hypothetical protein